MIVVANEESLSIASANSFKVLSAAGAPATKLFTAVATFESIVDSIAVVSKSDESAK